MWIYTSVTCNRKKISGHDVKRGDIIHEYGLVLSIDCDDSDCWYYDEKHHIHFICYQDPGHGGVLATFDPEDTYTLICNRQEYFDRAKKDLQWVVDALNEQIETIKEMELKEKK